VLCGVGSACCIFKHPTKAERKKRLAEDKYQYRKYGGVLKQMWVRKMGGIHSTGKDQYAEFGLAFLFALKYYENKWQLMFPNHLLLFSNWYQTTF
jgi:hypothetical protein